MLDHLLYKQQKFWRLHGFTLLMVALAIYFIYHSFSGNRGYFAFLETREQLTAAEQELKAIQKQREALDATIERLASHQIDPDLLEDHLRQHGYIRDNEVILLDND